MEFNSEMRDYMAIAQLYSWDYMDAVHFEKEQLTESAQVETENPSVIGEYAVGELKDLVFKLRAFQESQSGDYGYGFEMGMQRAADMVENLILRLSEENDGQK
jgi:hypothetical protein